MGREATTWKRGGVATHSRGPLPEREAFSDERDFWLRLEVLAVTV